MIYPALTPRIVFPFFWVCKSFLGHRSVKSPYIESTIQRGIPSQFLQTPIPRILSNPSPLSNLVHRPPLHMASVLEYHDGATEIVRPFLSLVYTALTSVKKEDWCNGPLWIWPDGVQYCELVRREIEATYPTCDCFAEGYRLVPDKSIAITAEVVQETLRLKVEVWVEDTYVEPSANNRLRFELGFEVESQNGLKVE